MELNELKENLNEFTDEFKLSIIKKIGKLAHEATSVDDFKSKLDELCHKTIGETSSEILAGMSSTRFSTTEAPSKPKSSDNSPLKNELDKVTKKIEELDDKNKPLQIKI